LIGVNVTGNDTKQLKDVMEREKLGWRSFADPGDIQQGAIATRWNVTGTPTLYVIDHHGVIRHKWAGSPGAEAIDAALEKLIEEAESNGESSTPLGEPGRDSIR
jgi:peroxiredoxin